MPWKELSTMNLKYEFVMKSLEYPCNFTELCAEYGISTKTGYKWKERFIQFGIHGLKDKPRRPRNSPQQVSEDVIFTILKIKRKKMSWGSPKIHKIYCDSHPEEEYISRATVDRILKKAGLVEKRKRRRKVQPERLQIRVKPEQPNDVWTVDFKGWWYTTKKEKCEPLTVRDEFSKYILSIKILEKGNISSVKQEFEHLFHEFGLPKVIRSDNGIPFASSMSILGLTRLSAWWMSLGIRLDRIDPASPYQNGGHERMHRDMKKELQGKIDGNLLMHQKIFDEWRREFNDVRPHASLDLKRPSDVYRKSERKYFGTTYELEYPYGYKCRRVNDRGWLQYSGKRIFISNALCGYYVGMKQKENDCFNVWFSETLIGKIDLKSYLFESILAKSGNAQNKTLPMS
jgi:transposase InsO family protein